MRKPRATTKAGRKVFVMSRRYTPGQLEILIGLRHSEELIAEIQGNQAKWVEKARKLGLTWGDIGQALGITGAAAWSRYGYRSKYKIA